MHPLQPSNYNLGRKVQDCEEKTKMGKATQTVSEESEETVGLSWWASETLSYLST